VTMALYLSSNASSSAMALALSSKTLDASIATERG
jgi:hypothetical protein